MDPVTLIIILAAQPVAQETLSQLIGKWLINGVLPSYVANNFPTLTSLLKKQPGVEDILKRTYKKAVNHWCANDGAERAAMRARFETYDMLVNFIKEGSFESDSITNELANLWYNELEKEEIGRWFIQEVKLRKITKISDEILSNIYSIGNTIEDIREELLSFKTTGIHTFTHNDHYIPRYCYRCDEHFMRLSGIEGDSLYDIVVTGDKGKHFVLLSAPLMGKTTELNELCWRFSQSKYFLPVLFELKNQGGLITKEMLPKKDYVESKAIVLVIDAIDEVSEYKFRDQLRELNGYANIHPNMRIVLSCRSNYRIHINDDYYTCLYLGTLTSDQVFEIASHNNCISNPSQFMTDVRNAGVAELTANPVFLNEVIEYYAERGGMPNSKTILLDKLIEKSYRIEEDKHISDNTLLHGEERRHLEQVATVMLMTGQQRISQVDLRACMGNNDTAYKETLHYGVINASIEQDEYEFEYNSIKEYLAASCLSNMLLDKVKALVCVESGYRIATHWYNTIVIYSEIASLKNGGKMPTDLYDWLSNDNKGLLLHTDKRFAEEKNRSKLLIEYIELQKSAGKRVEEIGSEEMKSIVTFGMSMELALYLLDSLKSITAIDIQFANLVGVAEFLDWNNIRSQAPDIATELEDTLLSFISGTLFNDKTEWICTQWIRNSTLHNKTFVSKLLSIANNTTSQYVINYTLLAMTNSNCVDDYYPAVIQLQEKVMGDNVPIGRMYLYKALSKLKNEDNVNDAFKVISKYSFYYRDFSYSMNSYREMEKELLRTAESIYKSGYKRIADTIKSAISERFKSYYGLKSEAERAQVANDYRRFYENIGLWEVVSDEVESLFRTNLYEPTPKELEKRAEIRKKQYNDLMNEALFADIVMKIVESPDEISAKELMHKCCESLEAMNQYAYRFVAIHTKEVDGERFIDKEAVKQALTNRAEYLNFTFDESMDILVGKYSDLTLDQAQEEQVREHACRLIYNLCKEDSLAMTPQQKKALELMLNGKVKIDSSYLIKLLRFSGWPFVTHIEELWEDNRYPLFYYIQENVGKDKVREFVHNEFVENGDTILDVNFRVWASFAIREQMKDIYPSIIKWIINHPEGMLLIEEQLAKCEVLQDYIVSAAENGSLLCSDVLASLLEKIMENTSSHNKRIQKYLENNIENVDCKALHKVLSILLKMGSIPALEYVVKTPSILENGGIYVFQYSSLEDIDKLVFLFGYIAEKNIFSNPYPSILNCLFTIALESKDNQKVIEVKMVELSNSKPKMKPFIEQWILNIKDASAAKHFRNSGVKEAIDWINL